MPVIKAAPRHTQLQGGACQAWASWPPVCWCQNSHYLIWRQIPTLKFLNCCVSICCSCHWLSQHCSFQRKAPILGNLALHNLQNMVTTVMVWKQVRVISGFFSGWSVLLAGQIYSTCWCSGALWLPTPLSQHTRRNSNCETLFLCLGGDHDIEQHHQRDDNLSAADLH